MIQIDIFSGFLGAGKTTLIKKLIREAYSGERVVLIENEFGEIGVDGGFLQDAGIEITEMNSGCICCSLVGDFAKALQEVAAKYSPDRIIIEPSGVGKLSDVIKAVQSANVADSRLNAFCTVVDAKKCKTYLKNFGEFFLDQIEHASCIVLSHTSDPAKTREAVGLLKDHTSVTVVTTDWEKIDGKEILHAMQQSDSLQAELKKLETEESERHHHHDDEACGCHEHHHHHDEECGCHEHHHHDEECGCHEHHHHDDEACGCHEHHHHDDEACGCHEHHHHDDEACGCHEHHRHDGEACGCHEHHHHHDEECGCHGHHHDADEVFTSWGRETAKCFTIQQLNEKLESLATGEYGEVLRAKGIVDGGENWLYFDYVPGEADVRTGKAAVTGRLCVIGCKLNEEKLAELFLG